MKLIDTHAHIHFDEFNLDREEVIAHARGAGVVRIVNVATSLTDTKTIPSFVAERSGFYGTVGIHPHDAGTVHDEDMEVVRRLTGEKKIVGVGETGLDFYRNLSPHDAQERIFRAHIEIAIEKNLPLVIHCRDAHADLVRVLVDYIPRGARGLMHCFSGDLLFAEKVIDWGFYISFAGNITIKRNAVFRDVAARIPLERILLETDSPYLSPEPFRGRRNEPARVVRVAETIAEVRGISVEGVGEQTTKNADQLFGLQSAEKI